MTRTSQDFTRTILMLLFFYGLWFGLTLYRRVRQERPSLVLPHGATG